MPIEKPLPLEYKFEEIRPGRYAIYSNGKFVRMATQNDIKTHLFRRKNSEKRKAQTNSGTSKVENTASKSNETESVENLSEETVNRALKKILQALSSTAQNFIQQIVFVSSILTGFIFTILFDLTLAPENINNGILLVVFAFLLMSGFSLLLCIAYGATIQIINNVENLGVLRSWNSKSINSLVNDLIDVESVLDILFNFIVTGSLYLVITFLFGILCFLISLTLLGWLRSPQLGLVATALMILFIYISYRVTKQILSELDIDKLREYFGTPQ